MQPHVRNMSSEPPSANVTGSSHKPLPSVPKIDTTTIVTRSPASSISYSPSVKRKPLPQSALSPPPLPTTYGELDIIPQTRGVAPGSTQALQEATNTAINEYSGTDNLTPLSAEPQSYYFETSPTTDNAPRVSIEDFPVPPTHDSSLPFRSNDEIAIASAKRGMGLKPGERPPPLRMDSVSSLKQMDAKKTASPNRSFTSFFMRKPSASPGVDSSTDISEGRSPLPSPYPPSEQGSMNSGIGSYFNMGKHSSPQHSQDSIEYNRIYPSRPSADVEARFNSLEAELKEISVELANSIRRELDLEDIVERLQAEQPHLGLAADRTSDYFSDSGSSSLKTPYNELTAKEEIDKIRRDSEQQRANLRVELSQKWQDEVSQRKALESHCHALEEHLSLTRAGVGEANDAKVRELERRLAEERQVKDNFEDLLTALKVDLEQHRSQRDNLRDEIVPALRARVQELEASLAEQKRAPHDVTKLQQELQSLRDENAALTSARDMERGMNNRNSMQFISEEDEFSVGQRGSMIVPRLGGLARSSTITGRSTRGGLARSGSLSRANSTSKGAQQQETIENAVEKLKSVEQQRDALHTTVKYLRMRQTQQQIRHSKRLTMLETEVSRASNTASQNGRKGGYEREVRVLRAEINTLRKRADDALDQKWQCEKGLAGLRMDLDRNKQETANLQRLLQARDSDPDAQELMSATLENAIVELQKERARTAESATTIEQEEHLAEQLEESAQRSESLAAQVKKQLQTNQALRVRLKNAVEAGETNQKTSAQQVSELQKRLKNLEDSITSAQLQSETAVMKHEEEVRVLNASHNAQLMRSASNSRPNGNLLNPMPRSPMNAFFGPKKSPRLDKTSSGPGMALHEALRTEYLENKVADLEKALSDAEREMGDVIGRMNTAQINVAELEAERDEAIMQTRRLEGAIRDERERYGKLINTLNEW